MRKIKILARNVSLGAKFLKPTHGVSGKITSAETVDLLCVHFLLFSVFYSCKFNILEFWIVGWTEKSNLKTEGLVLGTCDGHFSPFPDFLETRRSPQKKLISRLISNDDLVSALKIAQWIPPMTDGPLTPPAVSFGLHQTQLFTKMCNHSASSSLDLITHSVNLINFPSPHDCRGVTFPCLMPVK